MTRSQGLLGETAGRAVCRSVELVLFRKKKLNEKPFLLILAEIMILEEHGEMGRGVIVGILDAKQGKRAHDTFPFCENQNKWKNFSSF
jgi:hypothetical protein